MLKRYMTTILYSTPTRVTGALGSVTEGWTGERHAAPATRSPPAGQVQIAPYGEYLPEMTTLYLAAGCGIAPDDGVWLDGAGDAPDARVTAVRRYPMHTEADIRKRAM